MVHVIRKVDLLDAEQIADIYRPFVESTPVSFETVAPDVGEVCHRIEQTIQIYPWFVCEVEGEIAGYAYASQHRARHHYQWSVDVTIYNHPGFRRQGLGRSLYAVLLDTLRRQGFVMAHAGITLPNEASVGLHEALGFQALGVYRNVGYKCGRWHDVGWWQYELAQPEPNPSPPISWPDLRAMDGLESTLRQS